MTSYGTHTLTVLAIRLNGFLYHHSCISANTRNFKTSLLELPVSLKVNRELTHIQMLRMSVSSKQMVLKVEHLLMFSSVTTLPSRIAMSVKHDEVYPHC